MGGSAFKERSTALELEGPPRLTQACRVLCCCTIATVALQGSLRHLSHLVSKINLSARIVNLHLLEVSLFISIRPNPATPTDPGVLL